MSLSISIGKKITLCASILILPIVLLGYFFVVEKQSLIDFTDQEIAGVHYIRAGHQALFVATAPQLDKEAAQKAADAVVAADTNDAGKLSLSAKSQDLSASLKAVAEGKDGGDLVAKSTDIITSASDNSNITLDPDGDAYFVGDILVNQSTGVLVQMDKLVDAAKALDAQASDENKVAFAEARDGMATSAGNLATDLGKAIKNNADGTIKAALEADGAAFAANIAAVIDAANNYDREALGMTVANARAQAATLVAKTADEMERLLNVRNAGFYSTMKDRLGITVALMLAGLAVFWWVVGSITKSLGLTTKLMTRMAQGEENLDVPYQNRGDEIGRMARALEAFKKTVENKVNQLLSEQIKQDQIAEEKRRTGMHELANKFEQSVKGVVDMVASAATEMDATSQSVTNVAEKNKTKLEILNDQINGTSRNVQTVSSATSQLSSAINEISGQVARATTITSAAVEEAQRTDATVQGLTEASGKIGEVLEMINSIAAQINLLALNATIEAARAGEAGKGFAVVASEVKNLAGQTTKATEQIASYINSIQGATGDTVAAINSIGGKIRDINSIAATIAAAVEQQGAATKDIASNVGQAAASTQEVARNAHEVQESSAETGTAAHEMNAATGELARQAEILRREVDNFLVGIRA